MTEQNSYWETLSIQPFFPLTYNVFNGARLVLSELLTFRDIGYRDVCILSSLSKPRLIWSYHHITIISLLLLCWCLKWCLCSMYIKKKSQHQSPCLWVMTQCFWTIDILLPCSVQINLGTILFNYIHIIKVRTGHWRLTNSESSIKCHVGW